ncbi:MAG: serine hydrolase [Bacteroidetes bacterium]|nr:serine hydrolase [Bacteroidota bacterium]
MKHLFSLLVCTVLASAPASTQDTSLTILRAKTLQRLEQIVESAGGTIGVAAIDLTSGEWFTLNETFVFPQASAIKIPILMEVYRQADEGRFSLGETRTVRRTDQVGGSGILQFLGDGTSQLSIRDLCVLMIVLSDNTATNILIDLVGMAHVNSMLRSLGMEQTTLQREMMDTAASARNQENLSNPLEAARIMQILHEGAFVSREACDDMLTVLSLPKSGAIKRGLPADTRIAFKPGGISGVSTEWALVRLQHRPFAVALMEKYELENEAARVFTEIARVLYDYYWRVGAASRYGTYVRP